LTAAQLRVKCREPSEIFPKACISWNGCKVNTVEVTCLFMRIQA